MASQKPSIPKGTRDFSPTQMVRRKYIFETVQEVFHAYGYLPIETPAMENLSTLTGKYGEEGDRLLFKILNSGDFTNKVDNQLLSSGGSNALSLAICEKGLRYDLTVPFARFVVQHQSEITFPFKRYQIQPVWRADRPQKGRYREFYQCDVDIIGSNSLLNEAELIFIIDDLFKKLGIRTRLKLNNRKILSGMADIIGQPDKLTDITVAIDKIDKVGFAAVSKELESKGIPGDAIARLQPVLTLTGSNEGKLMSLREVLSGSEVAMKGLEEMAELFGYIHSHGDLTTQLEFDLSLARGLNYYTGTIFEAKSVDLEIGSICGGGRYDDLTGIFGLKNMSGVGVSFGADRIYDVMDGLSLFPDSLMVSTQVMFANFGAKESLYCMQPLRAIREQGISAELYPDDVKVKRQFDYANKRNIRFVVMAGEAELQTKTFSVKDMKSGDQTSIPYNDLADYLISRI